jgi:hypothetical protein
MTDAITNESITAMLAKPGLHLVSDTLFQFHRRFTVVEVLENGECYEVDIAGNRAGILTEDGWAETATEIFEFFITFHYHDKERRSKFARIIAQNELQARKFTAEIFGKDWAFIYSAKDFVGQPEKYGLTEL